ncbi:hypothetical protein ACWGKU_28625 [Kitasatospora sp. NPDC054768]
MSPDTPEQLNEELQAGWENLRSTAANIAQLQTTMWGDWAELTAGLATGRLAWGEVTSEFWKFVADEDLRFAQELSGLGMDYCQRVAEVTWEHEQRLRDRLRTTARGGDTAPAPEGDAPTGGDTSGDTNGADTAATPSGARNSKQ